LVSLTKNQTKKTVKQQLKQELIRPEGIDITHFRNELDIAIQQSGGWGWMLFFFVFLALFITLITFNGATNMPILVPALTWLATLYPLINLINHSEHKIYVNIDDHYISIKWRPKHFMKDKSFAVQDVDQVYVKKVPDMEYYEIYMIVNSFKGQKHVKLIQYLRNLSKAKYLEQEIERHLGITDRVVREEAV